MADVLLTGTVTPLNEGSGGGGQDGRSRQMTSVERAGCGGTRRVVLHLDTFMKVCMYVCMYV